MIKLLPDNCQKSKYLVDFKGKKKKNYLKGKKALVLLFIQTNYQKN